MRINYDAHNGYPYTPVGRILIERNIIPREQMSMQRIREWMEANPDGAKELRRQNRVLRLLPRGASCPTRTRRSARRACR